MRRCVSRGLYGLVFVWLLLFSVQLFGQSQTGDQNQNSGSGTTTTTPPTPILDTDDDSDSPDVPSFLRGLMDTDQYLKMRNEHMRRLRGTADGDFRPERRNGAIHTMRDMERRMHEAGTGGTAGGLAPTDTGANGQNAPAAPSQNGPAQSLPASLLAPWMPLGPTPIPNGQTTAISMAVSGRVTAIAVHPTNENIVYVGAAQGGVFRSLDGGATWTAIMDDSLSLAIGSIAIDPLDPTTLFVGTGEGNLSGDSFFGVGLYIIKHADTTPTLLGPFNLDGGGNDVFTGRAITRVLVSPTDDNIVFVSTTSGIGGIGADSIPSVITANLPSRGLYRSTNVMSNAPTFTKIKVQPANGGNRGISDLAFDPTNPNVLLAGVVGFSTNGNDGGIWRSTNALSANPTFTIQQVVGTATATLVMKFATNNTNGVTTVLAATGETPSTNGSNCGAPGMVRKSVDGGITFSNGLVQTSGFCNTQCFYDIAPAMDPTNPNVIYLGGSANADTNPPRNTCRANVLTRSLDGVNFSRIDTGLHADTHAVAVAPSNPSVVYFGSDGGVWRSSNQGTTWSSINTRGFYATQFQSIAVHSTDRNFSIGGTQDNGTNFFRSDSTWTRADFGDGGFALVDQSSTDTTNVTMYHTYFNQSNNLIGYARVTTTANAHDNGWAFFGCSGTTANNGFRCADSVLFYAPMALGPGTPNTLYFGTDRLYRSVNQGTSMGLVSQGPFVTGVPVSAIGISRQNDNVRMVGLRNGRVFATTTGATPLTEVTSAGFPAKYVSRAVIDPNDSNTAYVTFAGFGIAGRQIWKTGNLNAAPPTWTAVAAGLPDVPVDAFAIDPLDSRVLYAGSDIGVFISRDGGTSWTPFGSGFPRVAVFDMAIQNANRIVRVGTHGRGAWEIPTATLVSSVSIQASTLSATYGDTVNLTATVAGSNVKSPTGTLTFSDGATVLGTASLGTGPITATISTTLLSAGTHSITATFNGDSLFDPSTSTATSVVIAPAPLTVTANDKTRQYGQANPSFDGAITGIKNADNITATFTTTATPASPVGTYAITPVLADSDNKLGNYTVTSNNGTLTITPALLTVIVNNKSRAYGVANPLLDGIINGIQNGDNITATYSTTATPASPVGTYPITPQLADPDSKLSNYTITINNGTLTITQALLSVFANNKSRSYGTANPVLDGIITGVQNGDNITATYSTAATPASPVGTYAITPLLSDPDNKLGNYTVAINNGILTITPASLTVSANNKSRTYGAANPTLDGIITGIQNGDNITAIYTTTATANSSVGSYVITPVLQDPTGKLGNYSVTVNNGTLTITRAALVISADNKTKILNAPNPAFTASYSGFVLGEGPGVLSGVLTCTSTAVTNSPVGSYPITCSGQASNNYSITYTPGTLSVIYAPGGTCLGQPGHMVLPPIRPDGSSIFERESHVEAEFRVCDANGAPVSTPGTVTNFRLTQIISGGVAQSVNLPVLSKDGSPVFQFETHERAWAFDIALSKLPAGSAFAFRVTLNDGSTIDFAFNLRTHHDGDDGGDKD